MFAFGSAGVPFWSWREEMYRTKQQTSALVFLPSRQAAV
jgi:hypothetical protein